MARSAAQWSPPPGVRGYFVSQDGDGLRLELRSGGALQAVRRLGLGEVAEAQRLGALWCRVGPAIFVLERPR